MNVEDGKFFDLKNIDCNSLKDNTIFHNTETDETFLGKIIFDEDFKTLCAKAVAEYMKQNPDALEKMPMD